MWGGKDEFFKVIREDTGIPHPADVGRPALRSDCIKYFDAFRYLGASRMWSEVGPQAIQVSEVTAYLKDIVGIKSHRTRQKYLRLVQSMDRVEMQHIQSKQTKR